MTSPAGIFASMKVKMTGISIKTRACVLSGGWGDNLCCKNMLIPIKSGQTPIWKAIPAASTEIVPRTR